MLLSQKRRANNFIHLQNDADFFSRPAKMALFGQAIPTINMYRNEFYHAVATTPGARVSLLSGNR